MAANTKGNINAIDAMEKEHSRLPTGASMKASFAMIGIMDAGRFTCHKEENKLGNGETTDGKGETIYPNFA
jgi:hypothetical protein